MITKATLAICVVGAVGSLLIGFAGIGWSLISAEDLLIFPLVVGPYALIAGLAWWRRSSRRVSMVLLFTALLIAAYGFWALGLSFYRRYGSPYGSMVMDLTPLVMCAAQWLLTVFVALGLGVVAALRPRSRTRDG